MISFGISLQESDCLALRSLVVLFSLYLIHHGLGVFGFRCPVSYLTLSHFEFSLLHPSSFNRSNHT